MRSLVVLLLVANLILLAWQAWRPADAPPPRAAPLAASPLVLLSELPAMAPRREPEVPTTAATGTVTPEGCQALGPYLDREVAMAARDRLQAVDLNVTPRAVDASQRLGYWVHTAAADTRAEADAMVERLRRAGIRDFYVVADGEFRNAVSLGVFSQEETATQHAARLQAMGFTVEVGERRREITAWWLDFEIPESGSPAAHRVAELVLSGDEALVLQPRACD